MTLVLGLVAAAWLVGGLAMLHATREAAAQARDERLVHLAGTVLAFARHELAEAAQGRAPGAGEADDRPQGLDLRYRYQVWRQGRLLLASTDSPLDQPLAPLQHTGFVDAGEGDRAQRIHVAAPDPAGLQVLVADSLDGAAASLPLPGPGVLASMALSLLLAAALAGALLVRALRTLDAAAHTLRARSPLDAERLDARTLPSELRPLIEALNDQLSLAGERLSHERGFTALAAHELRTPLAALRMQAQVAARADEPAARDALLRRVLDSVDRCDHLIDQLLTLARIEQGDEVAREPVDLRELCQRVADELEDEQRARACVVNLHGPHRVVTGWDFALEVLVRNLVANALAHSPPGSVVVVTVDDGGDATAGPGLTVDDAGPGIAPSERARVFDRFVRLDPARRRAGAGLGLSIVRAVAEAHGARVDLGDSPLGGLRVSVRFPPAGAPADTPGPEPSR